MVYFSSLFFATCSHVLSSYLTNWTNMCIGHMFLQRNVLFCDLTYWTLLGRIDTDTHCTVVRSLVLNLLIRDYIKLIPPCVVMFCPVARRSVSDQ